MADWQCCEIICYIHKFCSFYEVHKILICKSFDFSSADVDAIPVKRSWIRFLQQSYVHRNWWHDYTSVWMDTKFAFFNLLQLRGGKNQFFTKNTCTKPHTTCTQIYIEQIVLFFKMYQIYNPRLQSSREEDCLMFLNMSLSQRK